MLNLKTEFNKTNLQSKRFQSASIIHTTTKFMQEGSIPPACPFVQPAQRTCVGGWPLLQDVRTERERRQGEGKRDNYPLNFPKPKSLDEALSSPSRLFPFCLSQKHLVKSLLQSHPLDDNQYFIDLTYISFVPFFRSNCVICFFARQERTIKICVYDCYRVYQ